MAEYTVDDMQDLGTRKKVRREFAAGAEAAGGKASDYYFMAERLGKLGDLKGKNYYTQHARELETRGAVQEAEQAGGTEEAYAEKSATLRRGGNTEGASTLEGQFAKMDADKRKRYKEVSEIGSQLSWGYIQNYNRYIKEFSGDAAKAEEQAKLDYGKLYYNTDPTHMKFLPSPEKMAIGVAYTLAGQSEKVVKSITEIEKWGARDEAVAGRSKWIQYRNSAFKELGVTDETVTPAQLRKIQKDFAATEAKPSSARPAGAVGEKDRIKYQKENDEIASAYETLIAQGFDDNEIKEMAAVGKNPLAMKATKPPYTDIPGVTFKGGKTTQSTGVAPEEVVTALKSGKAKKVKKNGVIWALDPKGNAIQVGK